MPVSWQIERLERELVNRLGDGFSVLNVNLYSLEGADRDAALDALAAGQASPFVLIHGQLVCAGAIEVAAVLEALG